MSRLTLVCALLCGAACAPGLPPTAAAMFGDDDHVTLAGQTNDSSASATPPSAEPVASAAGPAAASFDDAAINGRDLDTVLDAGPGVFLAALEVRPVFKGRRFHGWELVDIRTRQLAASPLRRGDLITRVNARSLKRPEDLQTVWDELRAAPELVVQGVRSGQDFSLRYRIDR